MGRERIVVVGGGAAGLRAAERLRELNFGGELIVIGEEPYRTYHRPGLTKHLLTGSARPRELVLPVLTDLDAIWRYGVRASHLEPDEHILHLPGGEEIQYDGLVIATGAQARHLPGSPRHDARVHVVRTVADAVGVQKNLRRGKGGLAVVGSGFLACELASAARALGRDATIITKDKGLLTHVPGADLGETVTALHDAHGVQIVTEAEVHHWVRQQDGVAMHLTTGQVVVASCVVLAVGAVPAVSWLRGSGLILDDGVMCDATCHAIGADDIVVAGDVARWPNLRFDTAPRRVEHWLNAIEMGRAAAESLLVGASSAKPYTPLPRFWTDQHGMRIQAAGLPALAQDTVPLAGSVNVGHRVTGYVSNGELVGVMGFDSPRGMLHWTAELESRTTEAMNRRPAPARSQPAPAQPAMPRVVAELDGGPETQAIPAHAMSAMEAGAAMNIAVSRAMDIAASAGSGRGPGDSRPSMPPADSPHAGGPRSAPPRRGRDSSMPPGGMPPLGPQDSWRPDQTTSMPPFGPLDSPPLGPEDSWPSMPPAGKGKAWPELPSVQAMDSWLSMPAVDSSPRLPAVRRPDSPPAATDAAPPARSSSGRRSRPDNSPPTGPLAGALDAASGRRAREAKDAGHRAPVTDETQSIPVVRETNLSRSERRAQAAEMTTSMPPVRDSPAEAPARRPVRPSDYSPSRAAWPPSSSPSSSSSSSPSSSSHESAAGPAMASVPEAKPARSGRHAEPEPEPLPPPPVRPVPPPAPPVRQAAPRDSRPPARPPTLLELAQTGEMPPVRASSSSRSMPPVSRPMFSAPQASSPGMPPVRPTFPPPTRARFSAPDMPNGWATSSSRGMPPARPMSTSPGMPPARATSSPPGMPPAGAMSSPGMPPVRASASQRRMPPARPTSTSPGMPPASASQRRMPPAGPTSTSPGMPPAGPMSSSGGIPPARATASQRRMPPAGPTSTSPGMPPAQASASQRRMPPAGPTSTSPGMPPASASQRRMPPAGPTSTSPGMPPAQASASQRRMPPAGPTSSSRGMRPAWPTSSSGGMPPARPTSSSSGMWPAPPPGSASSRGMPPVSPNAPWPSPPSSPRMPAIARVSPPPPDHVPDTPPRDRLFASVNPSVNPDAKPNVPPAPTFPPPGSRAAGTPPAGRAAPAPPPERAPAKAPRGTKTSAKRKSPSRRRKSAMPPPGTVSALPPVAPPANPGIADPSRYEEITPMG